MKPIQIHSQVGSDGVLTLRVPMGTEEAAKPVVVTITPANEDANATARGNAEWHQFVEETYGSCAGLGLERPDQRSQ
jgi:hypothetical protein